jgi:hypothetical protein
MSWPFLCSGRRDQIERLAWLIGVRTNELMLNSPRIIGVGIYQLGKTTARKGVLSRTSVRLCPKCIAPTFSSTGGVGIFQKLEWSVDCLFSCGIHNCPLITVPSAKNTHSTYDFVSRVLEHQEFICAQALEPTILPRTDFEDYVRQRIKGGPQDDWLRTLDLSHLYRASSTLGALIEKVETMALESLPPETLQGICQTGLSCLLEGPIAYKEALSTVYRKNAGERPYYSVDLAQLYKWLRASHDEPGLEAFSNTTREHVFRTYPIPLRKEVFGQKPSRQEWFSLYEAGKKSGFGRVFLKKLLGHMTGENEVEALSRTDVHIDDLVAVQAFWENLLSLMNAASRLGVSPTQIKVLQSKGVLKMIKITSSLRYFEKDEIARLLEKLEELPSELPDIKLIPINEYCRSKSVPLAQVIDLWVKGLLDGRLSRGAGNGLQSIEVDCDLCCHKAGLVLACDLELIEAAKYLKINIAAIRKLRNGGQLIQVFRRNPDTNHLKNYITRESILEFEKLYITLGQMASLQKVEPIHLARRLDRDEIWPITCAGAFVRVYDRHVIN